MESVRGFEFVTFDQANAEQQATHSAMLPFTRNVFDPMDFTPVAPGFVNPRIKRRTTSAFELATAVMFTSGIQHYAETPEGLAKAPEFVKQFLKEVPEIWDDVRFIDGYPGKFAVIARRTGNRWIVSGINGENTPRTVTVPRFAAIKTVRLINDGDGGDLSFDYQNIALAKPVQITMKPRGGFVIY